jgi:hypothetical protein
MGNSEQPVETADLLEEEGGSEHAGATRRTAALYVTPFLLLGVADLLLLLFWGLDPLWGFMILPPILFMSVLTWIAFRSGFVGGDGSG